MQKGKIVWLVETETEPRQQAIVLSDQPINGTVVVRLVLYPSWEDGLREVPLNQIQKV